MNAAIIFFIFCKTIKANSVEHLALVSGFKKNNQGISKGLSVERFSFWKFSPKRYHEFLHDDRGQHCATSGLDIRFWEK